MQVVIIKVSGKNLVLCGCDGKQAISSEYVMNHLASLQGFKNTVRVCVGAFLGLATIYFFTLE